MTKDLAMAHAIVHLRALHNFTQAELALRSGVSKNGIAQIERGRFDVGTNTLRKVAQAFGIEDWQLLQFASRIRGAFDAPYDTCPSAAQLARDLRL